MTGRFFKMQHKKLTERNMQTVMCHNVIIYKNELQFSVKFNKTPIKILIMPLLRRRVFQGNELLRTILHPRH